MQMIPEQSLHFCSDSRLVTIVNKNINNKYHSGTRIMEMEYNIVVFATELTKR